MRSDASKRLALGVMAECSHITVTREGQQINVRRICISQALQDTHAILQRTDYLAICHRVFGDKTSSPAARSK
jgi:hypothetical protein